MSRKTHIRLEAKLADMWIGIFWKVSQLGTLDIWICLLPCLPIHIIHTWEVARCVGCGSPFVAPNSNKCRSCADGL